MAKVESKDYGDDDDEIITPGGTKLSQSEFYAWGAVCIHRRIPEEILAPFMQGTKCFPWYYRRLHLQVQSDHF